LSTGDQLLSDRLHVFSAYRGSGEGITVWIVDGVQSDVCAESRVVPRPPGREGLLAYLRSIVRLHVSPDTPTTVDGRPATQVDLTVEGGDSRCPDHALFPWRDAATGQPIWISDISWVQLVVVDVAEATVVFEIWNQADLTPWLPTAHRVIDSIRFFNAPSGGSLPGVSPSPS
jgi:hypothetical protein